MPTKKSSRKRDEDGKFVSEKAIVSELGVNEENLYQKSQEMLLLDMAVQFTIVKRKPL